MAQQYYGLVTNVGLAKLAAAAAGGAALTLSSMAFGDGGGADVAPSKTATALVNERYRAPVVEKYPHPTNPSIVYVEGVIPSGVGGWTLREAGIYDTAGDLIVVAKPPAMDVALISEGASTEGIVRLPLVFESLEAVQLLIDPTVVLSTQGWAIDRLLGRPFLTVNSVTTTAPPAAPAAHSLYVVPAAATGVWAPQVGKLAYYQGGWVYRDALAAQIVGASDTGLYWRRTAGGAWVEFAATETAVGLTRLATDAETAAGELASRPSHPRAIARSVQSGAWNFAAAGGSANALTVTLSPAITAYDNLKVLWVVPSATNVAGPVSINVNGIGVAQVKVAGVDPPAGALRAGVPAMLLRTATGYALVGAEAGGRLLRSSIYTLWSGTQYVQVDGGGATTAGATSFTPLAQSVAVEIEVQGGGAGGSGCPATDAAGQSAAGGGGSGAWAIKRTTAVAASGATVTVGAGGAGGAAGPNWGANGGTSSVGAIVSALGGTGGAPAGPTGTGNFYAIGGAGGVAGTSGYINLPGVPGPAGAVAGGQGVPLPAAPGRALGGYYGSGGGSQSSSTSTAAKVGFTGVAGVVIIREYA